MSSPSTSLEICIEHLAGQLSKMDLFDRMDAFGLLKSVAEKSGFLPKGKRPRRGERRARKQKLSRVHFLALSNTTAQVVTRVFDVLPTHTR